MQILERKVTIQEAEKIYQIISDVLSENINTQVYVADSIMKELWYEGDKHHVYHTNCLKTSHYRVDTGNFGGEKWYKLTEGCYFDKLIYNASFIHNCMGYKQLVEFRGKGMDYTHFLVGIEQILFIYEEVFTDNKE